MYIKLCQLHDQLILFALEQGSIILTVKRILDAVGDPCGFQNHFQRFDVVSLFQIQNEGCISVLLRGPTRAVIAIHGKRGKISALYIGCLGRLAKRKILAAVHVCCVLVRFCGFKYAPLVNALVIRSDDLDTNIAG